MKLNICMWSLRCITPYEDRHILDVVRVLHCWLRTWWEAFAKSCTTFTAIDALSLKGLEAIELGLAYSNNCEVSDATSHRLAYGETLRHSVPYLWWNAGSVLWTSSLWQMLVAGVVTSFSCVPVWILTRFVMRLWNPRSKLCYSLLWVRIVASMHPCAEMSVNTSMLRIGLSAIL